MRLRFFRKTAWSLFAVLIFLCTETSVRAQVPTTSSTKSSVGIADDPCSAMPALPDAFVKFQAQVDEAKRWGKPLPKLEPSSEISSELEKWRWETLMRDFGQLCRYEAENRRLPPASQQRVVFFGDSITENWSTEDPKFFRSDFINRGISGQTTTQMIIRYRADVIDLEPHVVHLLVGTNDIAGNTGPTTIDRIKSAIVSMVEQARCHKINVLLGSVLPASRYSWRPEILPIEHIKELNEWLKSYARQNGLLYVDYYSAMDDGAHGMKSELTDDGVHPNARGYAVMDQLLLKALGSK